MTYFISIEELKQNNVINANVDSEYIEPALREAQDIFLREIIGDTLYNTIENKINGNTLTGKYLTLVNQYIKPYLENRMLASLVVPISMKIRNAGVIQQFDQGFNSSNVKDVAYLADYYNGRVEFYENRMTEYLKKNINDIPEYAYSTQNVTNPSQTHTAGTIYLGGGRKRPCGANYGGSGGSLNTVDWDNIQNRPDFAQVATSGSYNDLEDTPEIPQPVQSDWAETDPASMAFIKNKPTVPSGQVQSDWNQTNTSEVDYIKNKPTIPTVPTDVSAFNNDAGYITQNDVHTFKPIPNTWNTNGTMAQLIASITNDATAVEGNGYLGTVNVTDLPSGLVQGEIEIDIMAVQAGLGKNILFTLTSSNTSPYHWEYTSAWSQTGNWRSFGGGGGTVDWTDVQNKPNFATVATSGDYDDLQNKPTIPAAPVQSDWNENDNTSLAYIQNKPTIPAAQVQSDWQQNDSTQPDYIKNRPSMPSAQIQSDWNQTNTSEVDYIKNKPTIPAAQVQSDWNANSGMGEILNKPNFATVATSGNYSDLNGKPTIPAAPVQSDWNENDNTSLAYIQNKPSIPVVPSYTTETWTFTLQDNTTVTKTVYLVPSV